MSFKYQQTINQLIIFNFIEDKWAFVHQIHLHIWSRNMVKTYVNTSLLSNQMNLLKRKLQHWKKESNNNSKTQQKILIKSLIKNKLPLKAILILLLAQWNNPMLLHWKLLKHHKIKLKNNFLVWIVLWIKSITWNQQKMQK